jgi:E3 ubiquitin-protein ligase NEDD4
MIFIHPVLFLVLSKGEDSSANGEDSNSSESGQSSSESNGNGTAPVAADATAPEANSDTSGNSGTRGANDAAHVGRNEQPLPQGWDFSYSDKGRMFFIDHVNKTTSWIDPRTGKPSPIPTLDFESRIGPLPVIFFESIF